MVGRRSTGPGVFHADQATLVALPRSGTFEIHFRLQLMVTGYVDVGLELQDGTMRAVASGAQVPTARRNDLELPELPPFG